MKEVITVALLGAGIRGAYVYGAYIKKHPSTVRCVAVAEPDQYRREGVQKMHCIPEEYCFCDWKRLLSLDKMADAVIIATQDSMHYEAASMALKKGYHILMEKPISGIAEECYDLAKQAKECNQVFLLSLVLRHTHFYRKIKELLTQERIGTLMSIRHCENVGYWHFAHSFVRGNWRKCAESGPIILTKSCHDMDLLLWLADSDVVSLSSFGGLSWFRAENAPTGAAKRCIENCPYGADCIYNAETFYMNKKKYKWAVRAMTNDTSKQGIIKELKEGPYGRCVFYCDNDVMDHQLVNLQFQNGLTASYSMSAFTTDFYRETTLMGTKGEIRANDKLMEIQVLEFQTNLEEVITINDTTDGHAGGDDGIMEDFLNAISNKGASGGQTDIQSSFKSHLLAFAAEKSRLENRTIHFGDGTEI